MSNFTAQDLDRQDAEGSWVSYQPTEADLEDASNAFAMMAAQRLPLECQIELRNILDRQIAEAQAAKSGCNCPKCEIPF